MFYAQGENRRKRWYRVLSIGQKKLLVLAGLVALFLLGVLGVFIVYTVRASAFDLSQVTRPVGGGMLYDVNNELVASLDSDVVVPVSYEDLPQTLVDAFLMREDEHFFDHNGVVYTSVARSMLKNLMSLRYEQGASTISMQLTRNVYDLQGKTLDRKLLEVFLTRRIENSYDKKTILTQYLNRIYYGQSCYGIGNAARYYFGKKVKDLDLVECATLAGLVRGPSIFNPVANMKRAIAVRNETLDRMLETGAITQDQHDAAVASPIVLKSASGEDGANSYPVMWARRELDAMRGELGDAVDGASVVSTLCMPIQLQLEESVERALQAVEIPGHFPEAWEPQLPAGEKEADAVKKAFTKSSLRPKELKARGAGNDMKGMLQSCVLVVDMRRRMQGNVLAVVSGRSIVDGVDRWQGRIKPGRASAPLVFCCACLPGAEDQHIVANSSEVTGSRLGYDVVHSFISGLDLDAELPSREEASKLYNGVYPMRRLDLARVLFSLRNQGKGYKLSLVRSVWNRANKPVYIWEPEKAPEFIRRESAVSVAGVKPFECVEGQPVMLSEVLPDHNGVWTMISNDRGVAVFVWMGFDDPDSPVAASASLTSLMQKASKYLAREVHTYTRAYLREVMRKEKESPKK